VLFVVVVVVVVVVIIIIKLAAAEAQRSAAQRSSFACSQQQQQPVPEHSDALPFAASVDSAKPSAHVAHAHVPLAALSSQLATSAHTAHAHVVSSYCAQPASGVHAAHAHVLRPYRVQPAIGAQATQVVASPSSSPSCSAKPFTHASHTQLASVSATVLQFASTLASHAAHAHVVALCALQPSSGAQVAQRHTLLW
jgi:hypothetical protein